MYMDEQSLEGNEEKLKQLHWSNSLVWETKTKEKLNFLTT